MPRPVPDHSTGWWHIRVKMPDGSRRKFMLAKQPGWAKGKRLPKKPPAEVDLLSRKYQDMDLQIRHGVDVAVTRADDLKIFLAAFLDAYSADHRPNSVRIVRQAFAHFLKWCEGHGVKTAQAVTLRTCEDYMRARKKAGAARNTIASEKAALSPAWTQAVRGKSLSENPWALARIPGKPSKKEPEFWTKDELDKLIAAAKGWVQDLIIVTVNTGGRIDSILSLEWKDVHRERGMLRLHSKTGAYEVPINEVAWQVFDRLEMASQSRYVFPAKDGLGRRTRGAAYVAVRRAAKAAGVPEKGSYNHILRHTFASHAVMAGVPLVTVSKWLGHASIHMTMRYAHLGPSESRRFMAGFSLGSDPHQVAPSSSTPAPPPGQTGTSGSPPSSAGGIPPAPPSPSGGASVSASPPSRQSPGD